VVLPPPVAVLVGPCTVAVDRQGDLARRIAAVNWAVVADGYDAPISFEWYGVAIHDPFSDESGHDFGAHAVDPVAYYGVAYTSSVFVTDPEGALRYAEAQKIVYDWKEAHK
jgi:hypothetical protein